MLGVTTCVNVESIYDGPLYNGSCVGSPGTQVPKLMNRLYVKIPPK